MRDIEIETRVLADDLMFTAHGKHHAADAVRAVEESRRYFQAINPRVADNKCSTFAADEPTRKFLKEHPWDNNGLSISTLSGTWPCTTTVMHSPVPRGSKMLRGWRKKSAE